MDSLPAAPPAEARSFYAERVGSLQLREAQLERNHRLLGYLRLAFAAGVLVLLFRPSAWIALCLLGFGIAARVHGTTLSELAAVRRTLAMYTHGLARLEERWQGLRPRTPRVAVNHSLFATDLDLFGAESLFELLCEARTSLGEDQLALWLLEPSTTEAVLLRQAAIAELRSHPQLREAFARAPGPTVAVLDPARMPGAAQSTGQLWPGWALLAPLLAFLALGAAWRFAVTHNPLPVVLVLAINGTLTWRQQRRFSELFPRAQEAGRPVRTAAFLLQAFEHERCEAALL